MEKKKLFFNLLLLVVLVILSIGIIFFVKKINLKKNDEQQGEVVLKDIGYGSRVTQIGYKNADGIINNFISAYNEANGEALLQMTNLVATYIYSESSEEEFDQKYEEIMKAPDEYEQLVLMQYSLKQEEENLINSFSENKVKLTLMDYSKIEDTTKYLSKMTAEIRTVSESEEIDEVDTLEFLLLHRYNSYYLMKYDLIDSEDYEEYVLELEEDYDI